MLWSQTYYDVLDVSPAASLGEIRAAFHREIHRWHVDLHPDCPDVAAERTRRIVAAWHVLRDAKRREEFDAVYFRHTYHAHTTSSPADWNDLMARVSSRAACHPGIMREQAADIEVFWRWRDPLDSEPTYWDSPPADRLGASVIVALVTAACVVVFAAAACAAPACLARQADSDRMREYASATR